MWLFLIPVWFVAACVCGGSPVISFPMPRYLTAHTMACMTRQGAAELAASLAPSAGRDGDVRFHRFLVNLTEGRLFGEFEAPGREPLRAWLESRKIHFEWMSRIDLEATPDGVRDY